MELQLIVEFRDGESIVTYEQKVFACTTLLTLVGHVLGKLKYELVASLDRRVLYVIFTPPTISNTDGSTVTLHACLFIYVN